MEFFKFKKSIPFMKHALWFNAISFITFLLAVFFLWKNGLHLSIEFTGGAVMEVKYAQAVQPDKIRTTLSTAGVAVLSGVAIENERWQSRSLLWQMAIWLVP